MLRKKNHRLGLGLPDVLGKHPLSSPTSPTSHFHLIFAQGLYMSFLILLRPPLLFVCVFPWNFTNSIKNLHNVTQIWLYKNIWTIIIDIGKKRILVFIKIKLKMKNDFCILIFKNLTKILLFSAKSLEN